MDEKRAKLDQYIHWLADHGQTATAIPMQIAERALAKGRPFDADELLATFQPRGKISRPAVFRTLRAMARCGVIKRAERDGRAIYE